MKPYSTCSSVANDRPRGDLAERGSVMTFICSPEVQAALSVGRDDRWEKLKFRLSAFREYKGVLEEMLELESMSAKEGE